MKVLITGGAGFIGSALARALIWRGDDVIAIDNFQEYYPRKCKEFNVDLCRIASNTPPLNFQIEELSPVYNKLFSYSNNQQIIPGKLTFIEASITNQEFLANIFHTHKPDAVIHLGAMAGVPYSTKNPRIYSDVNLNGTTNLLELSTKHNIKKFVFGSSSSVYGNREDKKVTEEDNIIKAVSVYGATKVSGEVLCHSFNALFGLKVAIARIFGPIFGPIQRPFGMMAQRTINYVHNNKTIKIYGRNGLDTAKDSTYIDDQVQGLLLCLDKKFNFEVFNIGTSNPNSLRQLITVVSNAYGKPVQYEVIEADKADVISSADISKAQNVLGYQPKMSLEEGIRRQVEVFKLMPRWYQELSNV